MNMQDTKQYKLGKLGEDLVLNLFKLKPSPDPFDVDGDLFDPKNNERYEVKTQLRHPFNGCFTVNMKHLTNFNKCIKVDHLIFVEYNSDDMIRIWECVDRNVSNVFLTKDGRTMCGWKINKMKLHYEIEDPTLAGKMRALSSSKFLKR